MIRISTTTLEAYRRVLQTEYAQEDELIAQIKGKPFPATWQMTAGSCWHAELEEAIIPETGMYSFSTNVIQDARKQIGPGLWEVKASRIFSVDGIEVNVVAKVDHLRGLIVTENKTKFSPADPRDYEAVLQWRFYALIHQAACVRYNLWSFKDPDDDGYCEFKDLLSFTFWPYADLESDCKHWLRLFVDWAQSRGLLAYLERESSTPELEAA